MTTHDLDEDHERHPEWTVDGRPWCTWCCLPLDGCWCPAMGDKLEAMRAQHLDSMGTE